MTQNFAIEMLKQSVEQVQEMVQNDNCQVFAALGVMLK
jgi:hypothetical protein